MNEVLNIHIEHLVIEGSSEGDGERIGERIKGELARMLGEGAISGSTIRTTIGDVEGGTFRITPGMGPEQIGNAAAQSAAGGIRRSIGEQEAPETAS